jgi:nitrogen regulatory protein PII
MKAVFIVYNQALTEKIELILDREGLRGYTRWNQVQGRGTKDGEPHLGTHTWPALNESILCMVPAGRVKDLLDHLNNLNQKAEMQGLHAFVWDAEVGV